MKASKKSAVKKYNSKGVLPGKPDIVLAKYKTVIFVHGCFWHRHPGCKEATIPKTRTEWWAKKLNSNVERDKRIIEELENISWKVIVVWECTTKEMTISNLKDMLEKELSI